MNSIRDKLGTVDAICPTCKHSIRRDSQSGKTVAQVRRSMKEIAKQFKKLWPFAKIEVTEHWRTN